MDILSEIVQLDDDGKLFLSAAIADWKPVLERGFDAVIDLDSDAVGAVISWFGTGSGIPHLAITQPVVCPTN